MEEQCSNKIEGIIEDLKKMFRCFLKTIYLLTFKRSELVDILTLQKRSDQIMQPNSFLLICAIALGFCGKILERGIENIELDMVLEVRELTLSSFLNHSLPVFVIALIASMFIGYGFRKHDSETTRSLKNLNYYFVGYFNICALTILVLLSLLIPKDYFTLKMKLFIVVSVLLTIGFIILMFFLIQSISCQIIKRKESNILGFRLFMLLSLANSFVIAICILNFISPLYRYKTMGNLSGSLLDLEISKDQTVKLTYVIENSSNSMVTINMIDSHNIFLEYGENERIEPEAWFTAGCGKDGLTKNFKQLKPEESIIFISYVCDNQFFELIKTSFGLIVRNNDKKKAAIEESKDIAITLKVQVLIKGKGNEWLQVAL